MAGATITLTGTTFSGATAVLLGTTPTTFVAVNPGSSIFTVPTGAAAGVISVTTPAGMATSSTAFTVTATPATAPTLATLAATSALPGTTITQASTNLAAVTTVTVAGIPVTSFQLLGPTFLSFVVPATTQLSTAQTGAVVVTAPTGPATTAAVLSILATTVNVGNGDAGRS